MQCEYGSVTMESAGEGVWARALRSACSAVRRALCNVFASCKKPKICRQEYKGPEQIEVEWLVDSGNGDCPSYSHTALESPLPLALEDMLWELDSDEELPTPDRLEVY